MSYAGKEGCCLYCSDRKKDCWCDNCKCHSCIWYQTIKEGGSELGRCSFQDYLGFETLYADKILNTAYDAYIVSKRSITHILPKAHARLIYRLGEGRAKFEVPVWLKEQVLKKEEELILSNKNSLLNCEPNYGKPKICLK